MIELDLSERIIDPHGNPIEDSRDERAGLPSISNFERYAACNGSYIAERGIHGGPETAVARMGTEIHAVLAGEKPEWQLADDLRWLLERIKYLEDQLLGRYFPGVAAEKIEKIPEERLWYFDDKGEPLYSGKPDAIYVHGDAAVVIDYKCGWKPVKDAKANRQLRGAVVLTAKNLNIRTIYAAIIQPRCETSVLPTGYTAEELSRANELNLNLISAIFNPYAERRAGEHCEYCKAKNQCPTAITFFNERSRDIFERIGIQARAPKADIVAATQKLTPEDRAAILDSYKALEYIGEALKQDSKDAMAKGGSVPGWHLSKSSERREVADPVLFLAQFKKELGELSVEDSNRFIKVTLGKAEEAWIAKTGKSRAEFNAAFAGALDYKPQQGSLQRD